MYVYGCGKKYEEKEESILSRYKIDFIIDNFRAGIYETKMGESIELMSLEELEDVKSPIIIMRENFVDAWKEIRDRGVENDILFPYEFDPKSLLEKKLFSNGEYITEKDHHLYYVYDNEKIICIDECKGIKEVNCLVERVESDASFFLKLPIKPYNREFGYSRGTPIDRYYLEGWLQRKKDYIYGDVLEIAENTYTMKYGLSNVRKSYMLHVEKSTPPFIKGNFETGDGIEEEMVDCIILTQTLQYIYDTKKSMNNITKMLRPNGTLLLSVSGLEQISRYDMERWGDYWRFTDLSLKRIINETDGLTIIDLEIFGNVKSVCGLLYGIAAEELEQRELDYKDSDYPMILCALCKKE